MRIPQPRSSTTLAIALPCAWRSALSGWDRKILRMTSESSLTTAAVCAASLLSSRGFTLSNSLLSFSGSLPDILPLRPGPLTTTPHLCSVAYLTDTLYSGKDGSFNPLREAQRMGPACSKCLSALLLVTTSVWSSTVAKLLCQPHQTPIKNISTPQNAPPRMLSWLCAWRKPNWSQKQAKGNPQIQNCSILIKLFHVAKIAKGKRNKETTTSPIKTFQHDRMLL